ncbi:TPA: hypothetical protein KOX39_003424 [Clostridioides difficile]|nr:hypothetical protein [Clostridioides difficile]
MIKITGAKIDNKIVEVMEVRPYDSHRELVEIFFMFNGVTKVGAIVPEADLITEEVFIVDAKTEELVSLIESELGLEASVDGFGDCNYIVVDGDAHQIYISIDESGEFGCSTLHLENSKNYMEWEETYKNQAVRKTTKGALNYIKKFI